MKSANPGKRKPISQYHPLLYFLAVELRRLNRKLYWIFGKENYSSSHSSDLLPFRIKKHQSVLIRKLGGSEEQLQHNKVVNLNIAIKKIDGIIIRPGETFSFCKTVGRPTRRKGYLEGMELSFGEARAGIGGGLCQISNLLHWLIIHSPLTVTERYHHSFDPFPDDGRVLPFGSGATVFYNYRDFQFCNNTEHTFQLRLWISEKCLEGELRVNTELAYNYHIIEKEHAFLQIDGEFYRKNELWREKCLKFESGRVIETNFVLKNFARVKYTPEAWKNNSSESN